MPVPANAHAQASLDQFEHLHNNDEQQHGELYPDGFAGDDIVDDVRQARSELQPMNMHNNKSF